MFPANCSHSHCVFVHDSYDGFRISELEAILEIHHFKNEET